MTDILLKKGKEEALLRFHPWVFSGAILRMAGAVADGDMVRVCDYKGQPLAFGYYNDGSIAIRILSFGAEAPAADFWTKRLTAAVRYRQSAGILTDLTQTNCYRLVHAEGDGVPGLIIDIYADTAVIQCHSVGMHRQIADIATALRNVLPNLSAIFDKSAETLPAYYAANMQNSYIFGATGSEGYVLENGIKFKIDWEGGQKTGFFLDQRVNRQIVGQYAAGKTILNAFSYTGGFSMYALRAGAKIVHSVDISGKAIELANQNAALNAPYTGTHEAYVENVLTYLKEPTITYDLMVVDPPAFAKNIAKRHNAVQGYRRLNEAALRQIAPGGLLFTFSCSQVVDKLLFYNTIVAAAIDAGRQVRVLQHLSQPPDHPVSLFHPEGSYLKGLLLYVE